MKDSNIDFYKDWPGLGEPHSDKDLPKGWGMLDMNKTAVSGSRPFLRISFARWRYKSTAYFYHERLFVEIGKFKIWTPFVLIVGKAN